MDPFDPGADRPERPEDVDRGQLDLAPQGRALTSESVRELLEQGEALAREAWHASAAMSVLDDRTLTMRLG